MFLHRGASRIFLALLLVAMPHFGGLHRLEHATDQLVGLPQTPLCEVCLDLAALGLLAFDTVGAAAASPPPQATASHGRHRAAITDVSPGV